MFYPLWRERNNLSPLRKQMTEDLQLKGYSPETQRLYLLAVEQLARHFNKSPAALSEQELRAYFLHLIDTQCCSQGTLKTAIAGIKFCYSVSLQKPWPGLGLLRARKQRKLPVVLSRREVRQILSGVHAPVYRVCLNTIYACGLRISEGAHLQVADVDGERQVRRVRGKGNKEREVPLAQPTLEALRAFWTLHRSRPWLFPGRMQPRSSHQPGPLSVDNLRHAFQAALQQSGIHKPAHVPSLRHS